MEDVQVRKEAAKSPGFGRQAATRAGETVLGGVALLLVLQVVLDFSILDPVFWQRYGPTFASGVIGTLEFVALVIPVSVVLGFFIGWARVSRRRVLSWPVAMYVDFFRGMPPLVLVIFAFLFGARMIPEPFVSRFLAGVSLRDVSVTAAAIAVALHSSAFQAEIFRAGFQSIPKGQEEAAMALGMRPWQTMRHIILPQTFRLSLPPLGNELAVLIKDTSLLAVVAGGTELVGRSQNFVGTLSIQGYPLHWVFAIWTGVALSYFVMTFVVTRSLLALEKRFRIPGLESVSL